MTLFEIDEKYGLENVYSVLKDENDIDICCLRMVNTTKLHETIKFDLYPSYYMEDHRNNASWTRLQFIQTMIYKLRTYNSNLNFENFTISDEQTIKDLYSIKPA